VKAPPPPETIPGPGFISFYEKLGVSRQATPEEINKAFRNKSQYYHPDKHPSAEKEIWREAFLELTETKDILLNPEKREVYDSRLPRLEASYYKRQQEAIEKETKKPKRKYRMETGGTIPCLVPSTGEVHFGTVKDVVFDENRVPQRVPTIIDAMSGGEVFAQKINQRGYIANTLCAIFNYLAEHPVIEGSLEDYPAGLIEEVIRSYFRTGSPDDYRGIPRTDNLRKMSRVIRIYMEERKPTRPSSL